MKFRKYLIEKKVGAKPFTFSTTKDQTGHTHNVVVDENGDGTSISTSKGTDHVHKIFQWIVQPASGHIHNLDT